MASREFTFRGQVTIERWAKELDDWVDEPGDEVDRQKLIYKSLIRARDCVDLCRTVMKMEVPGPNRDYRMMRRELFLAQRNWDRVVTLWNIPHDIGFFETYSDVDLSDVKEISFEELFGNRIEKLKFTAVEFLLLSKSPRFYKWKKADRKVIYQSLMGCGVEAYAMGWEWQP